MKRVFLILTLAVAACARSQTSDAGPPPTAQQSSNQQVATMKIRITIEGTPVTATLEDNATARDFASLLPLKLTLKDYASTEKISDLPRRLSTEGAPAVSIHRWATSRTTRRGATSRSSTRTSATRQA
jgi:hypothetical protein